MSKLFIVYFLLLLSILLNFVHNSHAQDVIVINKKTQPYIKTIIKAARLAKAPAKVVLAICWNESSLNPKNPNLTHMDGNSLSHGLCQMKLETAQWMDKIFKLKVKATHERLEKPFINAYYSSLYVRYLLKELNDLKVAVDAYNAGPGNASDESEYIERVFKSLPVIEKAGL